jgi:hypothetical protein
VALFVSLTSCSHRSCEDAEDEYYSRLDECGVDYEVDTSAENLCTDVDRQFAECAISCMKNASCEAVREEGEEGSKVFACRYYCQVFIYLGLSNQ